RVSKVVLTSPLRVITVLGLNIHPAYIIDPIWSIIKCYVTLEVDQNPELLSEAKEKGDHKKLRPFYRLFGAPGWRAPIEISDFECENPTEHQQEFVAVDRFTGGAADTAKFNSKAVYAPIFTGTIKIDLERLHQALAGDNRWPWMLLAFVLRDLAEGDVSFGFGTGKGYGHVRKVQVSFDNLPADVKPMFDSFPFGQPFADQRQLEDVKSRYKELANKIRATELPAHIPVQRRGQ
ncbi:MAG: RAMP superfamily CRISPR-associated protein, partial [Terriglobia bacterium]